MGGALYKIGGLGPLCQLWLNADGSLNESLFYSDNLVKEGNELLAREIVAFYKSLSSHIYPTARSYKSVAVPYYLWLTFD